MSVKKFVIKTVIKVMIFAFLMIVIAAIGPAMRTVINNELAMTQMQPSNELYVMYDTYIAIRPFTDITIVGVAIWCFVSVFHDIHKFVKALKCE